MVLLEQQFVDTMEGDLSAIQPNDVMSSGQTQTFILIAVMLMTAIVMFSYLAISKQRNKDASSSIFLGRKGDTKYNRIILLYNTLDNLPPTRKYLNRLRREFEMIAPGDGKFAKERATWITLLTWGGGAIAIFIVLLIKPTLYFILLVAFSVYVLSQEAVNFIVSRNELILLTQFKQFLSRFRYHFLIDNSVDEAIYDAIPEVPHLMQLHARLILKVLQSSSRELDEQLLMYKNSISNMYLKQFLAICTTTMQNGDMKVDGQSLCLTNVRDLNVDIDIEIRKRRDIKASFSGATFMVVVPVYALQIISNWAVSTVSTLQSFYYGMGGTCMMLVCFLVTIAIYSYINQMKETHHQQASEHYILKYICQLRPIAKFTKHYWDKNYGRKLRIERTLKRTGSNLKAEHFLVQSIVLSIVVFILLNVIMLVSVRSAKNFTNSNYTAVASENSSGTEEQMLICMILTKYYFDYYKEQDIVAMYNEELDGNKRTVDDTVEDWFNAKLQTQFVAGGATLSEEDCIILLQQYNQINSASTKLYTKLFGTTGVPEYDLDNVESVKAFKQMRDIMERAAQADPLYNTTGIYEIVQRNVFSKYKSYRNSYFHWYFFLIAVIAGIVAYKLPKILLKAREEELQLVMHDEVLQYQSIILLLIYFENVNALTILEWMNLFSNIFSASIARSITAFTMDEKSALQELYDSEPFEDFQRIVENLMMVDDVGVLQAFNELGATRKSNQETRSQDNKNAVAAKASRADLLTMAPLSLIIIGYLVGPLLIQSFSQMAVLMSEMSQM